MKTRPLRLALLALPLLVLPLRAADTPPAAVPLDRPDTTRGLPVMQAFAARASARAWTDEALSRQELSELLWAANGINRPDTGKRTAASAMNAQDIDLYVFTTEGVYRYDAAAHALVPLLAGDHRDRIAKRRGTGGPGPSLAPVELVLVSDAARFPHGTPELRRQWGDIDAGIVSQNIALFCAGTGLSTRPRASVDPEGLRTLLGLTEDQRPVLGHPVGHAAEPAAAPAQRP